MYRAVADVPKFRVDIYIYYVRSATASRRVELIERPANLKTTRADVSEIVPKTNNGKGKKQKENPT